MRIIAHRGASAEHPENSEAAFRRALEIGVDGIELDLNLTRDGRLAVRHDDLIEFEGSWAFLRELTMEEIQRVDLGGGEKILSFDDALDLLGGRCPVVADIKSFGTAPLLHECLKKRGPIEGLHVTSFLHAEVLKMTKLRPGIDWSFTLSAIPLGFQELLRASGARAVSLFRGYLTEESIRELTSAGVRTFAYPVNIPREARAFASWGMDAIYTDDPAGMRRAGL